MRSRRRSEGDPGEAGDVIAKLDKATYLAALKAAEAQLARAKAELEKLENGSRPEETEQAVAAVEMFKAAERNAVTEHERNTELLATDAVAKKDFDSTLARRDETPGAGRICDGEAEASEGRFPEGRDRGGAGRTAGGGGRIARPADGL